MLLHEKRYVDDLDIVNGFSEHYQSVLISCDGDNNHESNGCYPFWDCNGMG